MNRTPVQTLSFNYVNDYAKETWLASVARWIIQAGDSYYEVMLGYSVRNPPIESLEIILKKTYMSKYPYVIERKNLDSSWSRFSLQSIQKITKRQALQLSLSGE